MAERPKPIKTSTIIRVLGGRARSCEPVRGIPKAPPTVADMVGSKITEVGAIAVATAAVGAGLVGVDVASVGGKVATVSPVTAVLVAGVSISVGVGMTVPPFCWALASCAADSAVSS